MGTTIDNPRFFDCWDITDDFACAAAADPAKGNGEWQEDGHCPYPTPMPTDAPLENEYCLDFQECLGKSMSSGKLGEVRCGGTYVHLSPYVLMLCLYFCCSRRR